MRPIEPLRKFLGLSPKDILLLNNSLYGLK
jgi:hypothetical protein